MHITSMLSDSVVFVGPIQCLMGIVGWLPMDVALNYSSASTLVIVGYFTHDLAFHTSSNDQIVVTSLAAAASKSQ